MTATAVIRQRLGVRAPDDTSRALSAAWITLAASTAVLLLANLAWVASGGHLYVVSTASMSPATPVGGLVLVQPASKIAAGDIITFHPYGNPAVTYTHRVIAEAPGPVYTTQGDENGIADPWPVHPTDIEGRAVVVLPAVGWLVRAFPWLVIGSIIALLFLGMVAPGRRRAYGILALVLLVVVPLNFWHPLVRGDLIASSMSGPHDMRVKIVNTGLLAVDFSIPEGQAAAAPAGDPVTIAGPLDDHGDLWVRAAVALPWLGWALVIAICLIPLALSLLPVRDGPTPDELAPVSA